ncbi:IPT/TIG domain-containing protein [Streptomyces pathocidini]|uniref:IPT/TIG domain-containing protein n=1 Tax=Streptomyces pathocidini TaxID=1650571 RepID=A0ABW7URG7_9ACTN|nr:IPT/TIG domain-containing protein [Streptomyces pathocidini]
MPITPNQGATGGGDTVTITGTNLANATAVHFGEELATITGNTPTSVTVTSPSGCGAVDTTVTTSAGTSTPLSFFYLKSPVVTSVEPDSGAVAGGDTITIRGSGLSGATSVDFGGTPVAPTVVSDSEITVVTPATAAGDVVLTVSTPGGLFDNLVFGFVDPPTAASFTPLVGPAAGGQMVDITGTDLTTASGVSTVTSVTFGVTPATFFYGLTSTRLAVLTPAQATGAVTISLTTTGGSTTVPGAYVYV